MTPFGKAGKKGGMPGNEKQNGGWGEEFGAGGGRGGGGGEGSGGGVRELSCICLNARSILNKMDEFRVLMDVLRPDVVGITESLGNGRGGWS